MSQHIVRDILEAADQNTTHILNAYFSFYVYDHRAFKWARKLDNCKLLLGSLPKPDLERILQEVAK